MPQPLNDVARAKMSQPSLVLVHTNDDAYLSTEMNPIREMLAHLGGESVPFADLPTLAKEPGVLIIHAAHWPQWPEALRNIRAMWPRTSVLGILQERTFTTPSVRDAVSRHLNDFLCEPVRESELCARVERLLRGKHQGAIAFDPADVDESVCSREQHATSMTPPKKRPAHANVPTIIARDRVSQRIVGQLDRIAATHSTVLITGETGTGKEVAARYIHACSERAMQPFVSVNCAAVPDTLLESELFGYERGAFTGAQSSTDGKFHHAHQGTLFLDEIADMTPAAQAKILRVLETYEVWRLGARRGTRVNVRIIAATNCELERLVGEGRFRSDLYYRLNVARVMLPPLRERRFDIPVLVAYYVQRMNLQFDRKLAGFTEASMKRLQSYGWPGNVRELKNVIEAAFIDLPSGRIQLADLPESVRERLREAAEAPADEAARIITTLNEMHWNVSRAAHTLHLSRMTLYRKIAKYGLSRESKSA
jgi:transcriptional regulator with PAS, ATPase and Fis domain